MHVVNLPGLTTWNPAIISSEKNKLAKESTDTRISYTTNTYLQNDANISGNVMRMYFIY